MRKEYRTYLFQALLFIVTVCTTTLAGMTLQGVGDYTWEGISTGMLYSIPFLLILTVHEFGHYIASRIHKLAVTLPYYIPVFIPGMLNIGTLGAVIRIKSPLYTKKIVMDVGASGPIAGFIVAVGLLFYGYTHLPPKEDIFKIHPEYAQFGKDYEKSVYTYDFARRSDSISFNHLKNNPTWIINVFEKIGALPSNWRELPFKAQKEGYVEMSVGKNLLILFFEKCVVDKPELIPNKFEFFHYPFIFAGFLALFFTALNLLPIGQLDGGHVLFALAGSKRHSYISRVAFVLFVFMAGLSFFKEYQIGNIFEDKDNWYLSGPFYLLFLYVIFGRIFEKRRNNLLLATGVFALQFFISLLFPSVNGIGSMYLVFGLLVGRLLGVDHPPVFTEEKLSISRKIVGWISLIIFILCFTPTPFATEVFLP